MKLLSVLIALLAGLQSPDQPASRLRSGMSLVYESGGQRNAWTIDSVRLDSASNCGQAWVRVGATPEHRNDCVVDGGIMRWSARESRYLEQRPVLPQQTRRYNRARGSVVEFATGAIGVDTIGAMVIPVIETTMLTMDSTGVVRRRLRERYAVGLTTATWGVFEVPDGAGWRVEREFRLVEIRDH